MNLLQDSLGAVLYCGGSLVRRWWWRCCLDKVCLARLLLAALLREAIPPVTSSLGLLRSPVVEDRECFSRSIMAWICCPFGSRQSLGISVGRVHGLRDIPSVGNGFGSHTTFQVKSKPSVLLVWWLRPMQEEALEWGLESGHSDSRFRWLSAASGTPNGSELCHAAALQLWRFVGQLYEIRILNTLGQYRTIKIWFGVNMIWYV